MSSARIFGVVVAAVEVQGADVVVQAGGFHGVECGVQEAEVVAVGAVDGPADGEAVAVGGDGPHPTRTQARVRAVAPSEPEAPRRRGLRVVGGPVLTSATG